MTKKFKKHKIGDDGFTEWFKMNLERWQMRCCDCGLVHDFEFEVNDNLAVWMRARRNERSTATSRFKNNYERKP